MTESVRIAMKTVAGGKVTFARLTNGKEYWLDRNGNRLPHRAYDTLRQDGLIRMEERQDTPPLGTKMWYRVLLSVEGRKLWMPESTTAVG